MGILQTIMNKRFQVIPRLFTIFIGVYSLILLSAAFAQEKPPEQREDLFEENLYTINFTNVSILEFIKFVSKITNENFIFNEQDLNFAITIVSQEPTNIESIMSALIQILRINGFSLIEQDNNLLIHKNTAIRQIPRVVSEEYPLEEGQYPPAIITRVYRVKNADPSRLASIITSMLSEGALVEVVPRSGHLIVSDVIGNIEEVTRLITTLDIPSPGMEVRVYKAKHSDVNNLTNLATQIMTPLAGNTPVIFVPQSSGGTVFVISTPYFADRALTILEDIDSPGSQVPGTTTGFYIYKIQNNTANQIQQAIKGLVSNLQENNYPDKDLISALNSARWITDTNSIVFTGTDQALGKVKEIIPEFDSSPEASQAAARELGKESFFIYQVQHVSKQRLESGLTNIAENLGKQDPLRETIDTMKWLPETNAVSFVGSPGSLNRLKEILATIDTPSEAKAAVSEQKTYLLYKIKNVKGQVIIDDFQKMASKLETSGIDNTELIKALKSAEWIKSTNSIYVSATPKVLEQVKALLTEFDVGRPPEGHVEEATNFFVYKPRHASPEEIKNSLLLIGEDLERAGLSDSTFLNTITNMRYVKATNSLIFTGTQKSIAQIQDLLASVDVSEEQEQIQQLGTTTFFIYRIKHVSPQELMSSLETITQDFSKIGPDNKALEKTIENMRYVKATNSLIFVGPKEILTRIQELLIKFDTPALAGRVDDLPSERTADGYVLYKPNNQSGENLLHLLKDFEQNLIKSGVKEEALYDAINNAKWMPKTSQILISGTDAAINKVQELLVLFDIPGDLETRAPKDREPTIETIEDMSFLLYKLQYHKGGEIESALQKIAADIKEGTPDKNKKLLEAINSVQWLEVTNSLIATGDGKTLTKLKELIQNIDMPLRQVFIEVLVLETTLNNALDFGLRWGSQGKYRDRFGYGFLNNPQFPQGGNDPFSAFNTNLSSITGTRTPTGSDIPISPGGFDLGIIGDIILHKGKTYFALGSLVNAIQIDGDTNIVLNQKIITQDGRLSTLFVGDNIPFTGSVITTQGGINTSIQQSIEYRDVGVTLSITPTLGEKDIITLDIDEEITEAANIPTSGQDVAQGIQTSKRSMQTRVHVPDRTFLVLSGQIRNQMTRQRQGLPCLGGLPLIGAAFSETQKNRQASNVIIFVKPHIVDTWEQYKAITENQESIYREQLVPSGPDAVEDFEEGLELLKTPDDN